MRRPAPSTTACASLMLLFLEPRRDSLAEGLEFLHQPVPDSVQKTFQPLEHTVPWHIVDQGADGQPSSSADEEWWTDRLSSGDCGCFEGTGAKLQASNLQGLEAGVADFDTFAFQENSLRCYVDTAIETDCCGTTDETSENGCDKHLALVPAGSIILQSICLASDCSFEVAAIERRVARKISEAINEANFRFEAKLMIEVLCPHIPHGHRCPAVPRAGVNGQVGIVVLTVRTADDSQAFVARGNVELDLVDTWGDKKNQFLLVVSFSVDDIVDAIEAGCQHFGCRMQLVPISRK